MRVPCSPRGITKALGKEQVRPIISDAALASAFAPLERYPSAALAVSGGPDSMALMHSARRWADLTGRGPGAFAVLTVDHGLRPGSGDEAAFVAAQAERLGLPHATLTWLGEKPKTGIQAAARRARYDLMTAYCRAHGAGCLATAHTADDQAETFLIRLRRGSGLDGLAAMAAVSERGGTPLIRPLLGLPKARLAAYLRSLGIPFVSDPSNSNISFERVRLRLAMKAFAAAGIPRPALTLSASRLGRSREALDRVAAEFLERHFSVSRLGQGDLDRDQFQALPAETALRVLTRVLTLIGGKDEAPRMMKAERLLEELRMGKREAALGGCLVIATPARLSFYREPGRIALTRSPCRAGHECTWDGRFLLSFAATLPDAVSAGPLGPGGWAIYRKELKERRLPIAANRLAVLTTPALWLSDRLIAAPALDFVQPAHPGEPPAQLQLVPRLSHFLKPSER